MRSLRWCFSLLLVFAGMPASALAEGAPAGVIQRQPEATIEWGEARVFLFGEGQPREGVEGLRKQLSARNAARRRAQAAYEKLTASLLPGSAELTDEQRSRLRELFRSSRLHTKDAPETQQAGYQGLGWSVADERYRVVVEVPLFGARSIAAALSLLPMPPADAPTPEGGAAGETRAVAQAVTGLIIDCTATPLKPSLHPTLLCKGDTKSFYGPASIVPETAARVGLARYYPSVDAARKATERVGANPLVIAALEATETAVTVSEDDARRVLDADKASGFLARCAVILVVNPGR